MKHIKDMNVKELYAVAKVLGIRGRSKMNKAELLETLMMEGVIGMNEKGIVYANQNNEQKTTEEVVTMINNNANINNNQTTVEGADVKMTRQQKRAMEREFIKTMGQFIKALNNFDPVLAEEALNIVKKGRSARNALRIVKERNGELSVVVDNFLNQYYVPRKFKPAKKAQVVVRKVNARELVFENGKFIATERFNDITDYSVGSGYMRTSVSDLLEETGLESYSVEGLSLNISTRIMVVDLPENNEENEEFLKQLFAKGLYIRENGVEKHFVYALRSNAQARTLKAMFILNDGRYTIASFLRKLGVEPIVYAKLKDGVYVLDVTKPDKRKGLSATNTFPLFSFVFGNKIRKEANGDMVVYGKTPFKLRVVDDVYAYVKNGKFIAVDKENKKLVELDASKHPQKLIVGDGTCFVSPRVAHIIGQETGKFGAAFQHRTGNIIKGMFVAVPDLNKYYEEDFVVFKSAIKGNLEEFLKAGHALEIRVARINPTARTMKQYTMFPYQFVHILNLSAEDMWNIVKKHLDLVKQMMNDPELLKKYVGMAHIDDDIADMDETEAEEYLDKALTTTLTKALFYSKGIALNDAYIKGLAFRFISIMIRRWMTGQIPVEGHYKYLIQDPKAILEALKANQRDEDGDIIVPEHVGLRPGQVVVAVHNEELDHEVCYEGKVALLRNPAVTQGEAAAVEAVHDDYYAAALKEGFYSNVVIVSCHDFTLVRQGGADTDGDTSFVVFEPIIVESVHNMDKPAILDRYFTVDENGKYVFEDGCPWPGAGGDEFIIKFKPEEYNDELIERIHEMEKKWVLRTLQQNKIGYLTDAATVLADKKRQLVYCIRKGMDVDGTPLHPAKRNFYYQLIHDFQHKIDWIRYTQGWEIDRAKHGGAYESHLAEQLAFVLDETRLPEVCSYVANKKTGRRVWIKPLWFRVMRKAQTIEEMEAMYEEVKHKLPKVLSVLDQHFVNMMEWWSTFKAEFKQIQKEIEKHNLVAFLSPLGRFVQPEAIEELTSVLKPIVTDYNIRKKEIIDAYKQQLEDLLKAELPKDVYEHQMEAIEKARKQQFDALEEETLHAVKSSDVIEKYDDVTIGYVAYLVTYSSKRTSKPSLSFAWKVMGDFVLKAIQKAVELEASTAANDKPTVLAEKFVMQAYVAPHLTKEQVAQMIAATKEHGVVITRRRNDKGVYNYYVCVFNPATGKYDPVAVLFQNIVENFFLGTTTAKVSLDAVYTSGRYVVNIAGSRIVKW
jgi:hypothetical protein